MAADARGLGTGLRLKPLRGLRALRAGRASEATPAQRLKAWRRGFSATSWLLYGLDDQPPELYLPDAKAGAAARIDGPVARSVLRNKLLFERVVGLYARVPRVLAAYERGVLTPLGRPFAARDLRGFVDEVLEARLAVVVKPLDSSEGRGVHSLEAVGGRLLLDKREATREEVAAALEGYDGALVQELVRQGGFPHRVFPDSLNTIRVVTMVDPDTGEPFVASALHRFGTRRSAPTDNSSRGAVRCAVDVATGRLSAGGATWAPERGARRPLAAHPDTGVRLEGAVVERWDEVKEALARVVRALPFLVYVGWDVAVTDDGVVVVEGNHSPDLNQQVAGPYLADPRVRRFLQHHGVA